MTKNLSIVLIERGSHRGRQVDIQQPCRRRESGREPGRHRAVCRQGAIDHVDEQGDDHLRATSRPRRLVIEAKRGEFLLEIVHVFRGPDFLIRPEYRRVDWPRR
jgi:hypothetical protein